MRRAHIALLAAGVALAGCGANAQRPDATGSSSHRGRDVGARSIRCADAFAWELSLTAPISPQTGEHGRVFALINRAATACALDGTPTIALYAGRRRLPFRYRFSAGHRKRRYSSSAAPHRVIVQPGRAAFFLAAKYRCDLGVAAAASFVVAQMPGRRQALRLALPPRGAGYGVGDFDYCRDSRGRGAGAPGSYIDLSAIAATEAATFGVPY